MSDVPLTILGGGPAGLAAGYYAHTAGIPFQILEAGSRVGGNAVTFEEDGFRFDSGAHRFHDQDAEVTETVKNLLGDDLVHISVPSQIYHDGVYIDFPLSPLDLVTKLGPIWSIRAGLDLLAARLGRKPGDSDFEAFSIYRYGRRLAELFLLNYSEKLWGLPTNQLSPTISGSRLKNLTLRTLLKEALEGREAKTAHLDGSFYYPRHGYGMIADALAEACGYDNIKLQHRITRVYHRENRIEAIEVNRSERIEVDEVISTLPLSLLLSQLDPPPPAEIMAINSELRFRNVILVAVFIDRERISDNGSIYFPDASYLFTRVYEPKNRSQQMSPPGKTSLCAEIPCSPESDVWNKADSEILALVEQQFIKLGWLNRGEILGGKVIRMPYAYPVLEAGIEDKLKQVYDWLKNFRNLRLVGRNGEFQYTHVHYIMRSAQNLIDEYRHQSASLNEINDGQLSLIDLP